MALETADLSPVQRGDLACVGVSKTLARGRRPVDPMARYFLHRLYATDAKREWVSMAPTYDSLIYRDFIAILDDCMKRMPPHKRPPL